MIVFIEFMIYGVNMRDSIK